MKNLFFLCFSMALVAWVACDSPTTTGIDARPKLYVSTENLTLTGTSRYDIISLTNSGGSVLEWSIVAWPEWLGVSAYAGAVINDTLSLRLTTDFQKLVYGLYEGIIKITSNGGDATIAVKLNYTAPVLTIDIPTLNFDRHYLYAELLIQNSGGGELMWRIDALPGWLQVEVMSGSVFGRSERVPFRARLKNLPYGTFEDKVEISSNGGQSQVKVYLTFEREVEIYPGIGAANVNLGDSYTMVQNRLGKPDHNWYDRPAKTLFIHHFTYDDIGVHLSVKTNSLILYGSGKVGYIEVHAPYDGMTPELIGIGSTADELTAAYGQPSQENSNQWYYDSGITYILQNDKIAAIIIQADDF